MFSDSISICLAEYLLSWSVLAEKQNMYSWAGLYSAHFSVQGLVHVGSAQVICEGTWDLEAGRDFTVGVCTTFTAWILSFLLSSPCHCSELWLSSSLPFDLRELQSYRISLLPFGGTHIHGDALQAGMDSSTNFAFLPVYMSLKE